MVRFNRSFGAHCTCILQECCLLEVVYCSNQHATSGPTQVGLPTNYQKLTNNNMDACACEHLMLWWVS